MLSKLQKLAVSGTAAVSSFMTAAYVYAQNGQPTNGQGSSGVIGNVEPGKGYSTSFGSLISSVLSIVMVVALLLVLLYLVLGGIEWITSGGDKGKTEGARNKITAAIIGIIILAAAYALVQLVAYVLGFGSFNEAINGIPKIK